MNFRFNSVVIMLITFSGILSNASAQDRLLLERKSNPSKKRYLNLEREYHIKTADTTYSDKKIIGFTDTTISIIDWKKMGDTTYYRSYTNEENRYITNTYREGIFRKDTIAILFTSIHTIKKDWFRTEEWLANTGFLLMMGAAATIALPVMAIDQGAKGVRDWAVVQSVLVGVPLLPVLIGTRKTKYDLEKKWTLKTGK